MAVANVAALLAKWGHRVLVVDWDLEAPGIEQYFRRPPSSLRGSRADTPGVLDLLAACAAGTHLDWRACLLRATPYPHAPPVSIISAGQATSDYVPVLQGLDWEALFDEHDLGSYLNELRQEWADEFDFVLIDSRTGINDIGGICTIILPDVLVLLFTTNEQSSLGARDVAVQAREAQARLPTERSRLVIVPLPSRDESRSEYDDAEEWRGRFAKDFADLFEDWLPRGTTPARVLRKLYIPYWAKWSFGERLPVVEAPEEIDDPGKISAAYARVAALLASGLDWGAVEGEAYQAQAETRAAAAREQERTRATASRRLWQVSAASVVLLAVIGLSAFFGYRSFRESTRTTLEEQLRSTDAELASRALLRLVNDYDVGALGLLDTLPGTPAVKLDVIEQVYRDFATWPEAFGAMVWVLDDIAARNDSLRDRALELRETVRRELIAAKELPPPNEAEDTLLNRRVLIQGGTFKMGSTAGAPGEELVRNVTVASFLMQEHEVTNEEYQRFDPDHESSSEGERHPVVAVSWYEAMAYAAWLGGSLPTEAQWEYAARGQDGREFPWGDQSDFDSLMDLDPTWACRYAVYDRCSGSVAPVKSTPLGATPDSIYDLAGNVLEWVSDWYSGRYDPTDTVDPRGPAAGSQRVLRGSAFVFDAINLRGWSRFSIRPEAEYGHQGFRVVWSSAGRPN